MLARSLCKRPCAHSSIILLEERLITSECCIFFFLNSLEEGWVYWRQFLPGITSFWSIKSKFSMQVPILTTDFIKGKNCLVNQQFICQYSLPSISIPFFVLVILGSQNLVKDRCQKLLYIGFHP